MYGDKWAELNVLPHLGGIRKLHIAGKHAQLIRLIVPLAHTTVNNSQQDHDDTIEVAYSFCEQSTHSHGFPTDEGLNKFVWNYCAHQRLQQIKNSTGSHQQP